MKINSPASNEKSTSIMFLIIIAVIAGIVFGVFIKFIIQAIKSLILLASQYWIYIVVVIGVVLLARKIFLRPPQRVQEMRVVR